MHILIALLPSCSRGPFLFLFISLLRDFHSISHMNLESELYQLWKVVSPTLKFWPRLAGLQLVALTRVLRLLRGSENSFRECGIYLQFIFMPWLWFRVEHRRGAVFWHCSFGKREKGTGSRWLFSHAVSAFGAPGSVGLGWTGPIHNRCLLWIWDFDDTIIILVMHEVLDFSVILVGSQHQSPFLPFICLNEGSHCGHMQIWP